MKYVIGNKSVVFDLEPGVYTAFSDSAEGKTYTAKLLSAVLDKDKVLVLTYESVKYLCEESIRSLILSKHYEVIFVDRADLYITENIFTALEESGAIVYLDCKNNNYDYDICGKDCYIEFTEKEIRYVGSFRG